MGNSDDLSRKERAVLFALLGEACELSNLQLAERVGFRLTGAERRNLNGRKLVDSRKIGQTYAHELSDAGWHWCAKELSAAARPGATSMERALYAILGGIARHLDDTERSLADIFRRPAAGKGGAGEESAAPSGGGDISGDIDAEIMTAYHALASHPGEFVKLRELRGKLTGIPRAELDAALTRLYRARHVNLVPQAN